MDTQAIRSDPAKDTGSDLEEFSNYVRRILSVPHSEVQRRLEAEKRSKASASLVPVSDKTNR